eukprot:2018378-Pleurochrysis_carterae.AAC.1
MQIAQSTLVSSINDFTPTTAALKLRAMIKPLVDCALQNGRKENEDSTKILEFTRVDELEPYVRGHWRVVAQSERAGEREAEGKGDWEGGDKSHRGGTFARESAPEAVADAAWPLADSQAAFIESVSGLGVYGIDPAV